MAETKESAELSKAKASDSTAPALQKDSQPVPASYNIQQITQVNTAIPAHVWTTEALMDLHAKQAEAGKNNIRSLDDQRKRDHKMAILGYCLVSAVILAGLIFMYKGTPGGKEIILGTMTFLAGYLAGRNAK
jgi:hypothetical protein